MALPGTLVTDDQFDPDDPVGYVYQLRKDSIKHQESWRTEARMMYEYRDGNQWDSEDIAALEEMQRPAVTFNRIGPIIDAIVGNEMGNRQEVRYIPRTQEDAEANETYTAAAQWVRDRCDAEDEESDAFTDALTCGMGWTETRVDFDDEPDGKIVIERVPPLEMRWDPQAKKHNLDDSTWFIREKWVFVDYIRERWPHKADEIEPLQDVSEPSDWSMEPHDATNAWQYRQDQQWFDPKENKVLLIHFQWKEREKYYRVQDPSTGEILEMSFARVNKIRDFLDNNAVPYVQQNRWVYRQKFIAGKTLLSEGRTPVDDEFSFHAITAKRDEEENYWYGLVRAMKDPQDWANKFFSQAMHIFNSNAKGGVIIEEGAVENMREFEDNWARADGIVEVAPGALTGGMIQQQDLGGYPSSLDKLLQFAISSIRDCSGVNLELLGMANREQAGFLEVERKKTALIVLQPLVNSLRRYRKMQGRTLLRFMVRYIPEGTIFRLTNQDPVVFYRDPDVRRYDVIVDTAPTSPNLKMEVWSVLQNVIPAMVRAGVPLPPQLIEYSPLPSSVAQEWIQYIEERSQTSPEQVQQMQEQLEQLTQENQDLRSKREEKALELEMKRESAALDAQIKRESAALNAYQAEQDRIAKMQMSDADRAAKLLEMSQEFEMKMMELRGQTDAQLELNREKMASEREMAAQKLAADKEVNIISIQAERERREAEMVDKRREVEEKDNGDTEAIEARVDEVSKKFDDYVDEAAQRRSIILEFLKSQGGDIAQVAERLT